MKYSLLLVGGFLGLACLLFPDEFMNFISWRLWSLLQFRAHPNFATSGRWDNWKFLYDTFSGHPLFLLFGAGYKSLSNTPILGKKIIGDNAFLSMMVETGIPGLLAFLYFNYALLATLLKKNGNKAAGPDFFAQFMAAFWVGELFQMLTGDIFTYWRNLMLFFTVLAMVRAPLAQGNFPPPGASPGGPHG